MDSRFSLCVSPEWRGLIRRQRFHTRNNTTPRGSGLLSIAGANSFTLRCGLLSLLGVNSNERRAPGLSEWAHFADGLRPKSPRGSRIPPTTRLIGWECSEIFLSPPGTFHNKFSKYQNKKPGGGT
jgi:DUF3072 family protein